MHGLIYKHFEDYDYCSLNILVQFRDYPLYIWHIFDFRRQIIVCSMSSIFYTIDELWLLCIDTLVLRFDNHVKMWDFLQDSHLIHVEITLSDFHILTATAKTMKIKAL